MPVRVRLVRGYADLEWAGIDDVVMQEVEISVMKMLATVVGCNSFNENKIGCHVVATKISMDTAGNETLSH